MKIPRFYCRIAVSFFALCTFLYISGMASPCLLAQTAVKKNKKSPSTSTKSAKESPLYEAYRGTWFGLYFPRDWHVRPSLRDDARGADDSVFFTALDSAAEFYVYCPRYSGKPTDIEIDRTTEEQISQTIEEKDGVRIRTVRIKAKDGSYTRIFEDTVAFIAGRRLTFGFKFRDSVALAKYDSAYVYFKSSFRKFTD